ncbi:hypothetical protein CLF_103724 [Clonorchis sinensis]|uniref:Uncharacterized protein n=1 Tax=Clonorchis sinensis TaxID=79923 RepID=G7YNL1_CLOSI|nr:hypothetical protein CLF_103724 [Clonorchis sinensis]
MKLSKCRLQQNTQNEGQTPTKAVVLVHKNHNPGKVRIRKECSTLEVRPLLTFGPFLRFILHHSPNSSQPESDPSNTPKVSVKFRPNVGRIQYLANVLRHPCFLWDDCCSEPLSEADTRCSCRLSTPLDSESEAGFHKPLHSCSVHWSITGSFAAEGNLELNQFALAQVYRWRPPPQFCPAELNHTYRSDSPKFNADNADRKPNHHGTPCFRFLPIRIKHGTMRSSRQLQPGEIDGQRREHVSDLPPVKKIAMTTIPHSVLKQIFTPLSGTVICGFFINPLGRMIQQFPFSAYSYTLVPTVTVPSRYGNPRGEKTTFLVRYAEVRWLECTLMSAYSSVVHAHGFLIPEQALGSGLNTACGRKTRGMIIVIYQDGHAERGSECFARRSLSNDLRESYSHRRLFDKCGSAHTMIDHAVKWPQNSRIVAVMDSTEFVQHLVME